MGYLCVLFLDGRYVTCNWITSANWYRGELTVRFAGSTGVTYKGVRRWWVLPKLDL